MDLYRELHPTVRIPPSQPSEYPKWVVSEGGERVVVQSAQEESRVTGKIIDSTEAPSSCETVNALFAAPEAAQEQEGIGEKGLLQLEASNMGIEVDRRWGVKKLRAVIEAHS